MGATERRAQAAFPAKPEAACPPSPAEACASFADGLSPSGAAAGSLTWAKKGQAASPPNSEAARGAAAWSKSRKTEPAMAWNNFYWQRTAQAPPAPEGGWNNSGLERKAQGAARARSAEAEGFRACSNYPRNPTSKKTMTLKKMKTPCRKRNLRRGSFRRRRRLHGLRGARNRAGMPTGA